METSSCELNGCTDAVADPGGGGGGEISGDRVALLDIKYIPGFQICLGNFWLLVEIPELPPAP